jgi:DNA-binding protein YbaB
MGLLNKFKQGAQTISKVNQAKKFQKELEKTEVSEEKGGVRVKVNGAQQIVYLEIDGAERKDVIELINKAMQSVQKKVAQEHSAEIMKMLMGGMS